MDPTALTAGEARAAIAAGTLSPVELVDAALARIEASNDELHAYLHVDADGARSAAAAAERAAADGDGRLLLGLPVCVKDVIDVAGMPTSAGAASWKREPTQDAPSVARLRAQGAVILGKGNTNEFAYGIDGRNPHWGDVVNPLDPERLPGGSSAGPAVAVATGMALLGVGTDTTGSLRVPAALCGLAALRPTLGAVPTAGVVPLAWSYDVVGPIAKTVSDTTLLWSVLSGIPPTGDARLPRVGRLDQLFANAAPTVAAGVGALADGVGAEPVRVEALDWAEAIHTNVQMAEASSIHAAWWDRQRDRYSQPVRQRLELGRLVSATDYLRSQQARRVLVDAFLHLMEEEGLVAMLCPTTLDTAPRVDGDQAAQRDSLLPGVRALSQTGGPVVSLPAGLDAAGLPFGISLAGRPGDEAALLSLAATVERMVANH